MSRQNLRICQLVSPTSEQLSDAGRVLAKAFSPDPMIHGIFGDQAHDEDFFFQMELSSVTGASEEGELWVAELADSDGGDGKIVGVACWYGPGQAQHANPETRARSDGVFAALPSTVREWWKDYFRPKRSKQADKQLGKDTSLNNWYLHILGVMPGYHNQGIGRALVEAMKDRAFTAGKCICLEASNEKNLQMYKRWGFRDMGSEQYDTPFAAGFRMWMLSMPPPER